MPQIPRLFIKAEAIPEGAHWITVHPGGMGKGQPVLIQPQNDGTARVIGGAGGKLNYLKLRGVKSKAEYKEEAGQRAADKRNEKAAQKATDQKSGVWEAKKQAREDIQAQKKQAEQGVIAAVAQKAGWSESDLAFNPEDYAHLSPAALAKVEAKHHANLLGKAKDVIRQSREKLVSDAAARDAAGIGEVPLFSTNPDAVSVADLDPSKPPTASLGFQAHYGARAKAKGLTDEALQAEAAAVKGLTDEQRQQAFEKGKAADLIAAELAGIKEPAAPNADGSLLAAQDALELVKEGKKLEAITRAARAAHAEVDNGATEAKAFVLETSPAELDAAARAQVMGDLRTVQTAAFLAEVGKVAGANPDETLGGHIGVGAYNSINSLALAVGGAALVDRSVVDVLGIAGAAQVLARRVQQSLPPDEAQMVADGMQDWHMNHYMATSTEALKKAQELQAVAAEIEVSPEATNGTELGAAQELNARRRAAIGDAQRIVGQALGEMEANASLTAALMAPQSGDFEVSLGRISAESAITRVRALGLGADDYRLEKVGGDTFLTVTPAGMDALAQPIDRESVQQVKRNLAIIRGDQDEDGWLPMGVANRPDLIMDVPEGTAEKLAQPFQPGADLQASLKSYIGARAADGDSPVDILADVQSADFFTKVGAGRADDYRAALDAVAPLKNEEGQQQRAEELADTFDTYADEHVAGLGGERSTLNKQQVQIDKHSVEALHRALAAVPEGTVAYKQIGDLDGKDQSALREFFYRNIAKESPDAAKMRQELQDVHASEPEKEAPDMFGESGPNPDHTQWKTHRDQLSAKVEGASLTWGKYLKKMGGNEKAYEAVQDVIRSHMAGTFASAHNKLNPGAPIKVGKRTIRNNLAHLDAVDPSAREARISKDRELIDGLRQRSGGKYAAGGVADKIESAKKEQAAYEQAQMGFFSSEEAPPATAGGQPPEMGADERHTLGHVVERQLSGMMAKVGQNFKKGQPTKLWGLSMSGKYAPQQRAIKLLAENKRISLAAGAGSGKTNMMLGGHAHLAGLGKVKRSIMMVPSIVQGQFNGEALRLLEPGKFKAHIQPGASQAERIAAYKDPDTHICVMTHQSFRDDMVHLGAQAAGVDEAAMGQKLAGMSRAERKQWATDTMAHHGINFDASFVDEAHDTLNRAGKDNSTLSNVLDSVTDNTPYYTYASGDPVKNDASEIHSMLEKMDPERYADRSEFMRRYGADTIASKQALQREMARYVFPTSITPDVARNRVTDRVDLSPGQKHAMKSLDASVRLAKLAERRGEVDVEACKEISPNSFAGVPPEEHEKIAAALQKTVGILKQSAQNRIINSHSDNAKVRRALEHVESRPGKQGVIFAKNRASIEQYKTALEAAGKRVAVVTGADGAKEKDRKRRMFNPESGAAQADILLASDAAAVGMNLQSGQYLIQHDTPDTAKTHSQRNARIDRIGQQQGIDLIDLVGNHKSEDDARTRLQRKYGLKDMMASPLDGLDDTGVAGAINARRAAAADGQGAMF